MSTEADCVVLSYRYHGAGEAWRTMTETVSLLWTPCQFGGQRPWFLCPGLVNGQACGRRVAILYSEGPYFWCRQCHELAYDSQRETREERLRRRGEKIRRRLGGSLGSDDPAPSKPPRMHWRTYWRLHEQLRSVESEVFSLREASQSHQLAAVDRYVENAKLRVERVRKRVARTRTPQGCVKLLRTRKEFAVGGCCSLWLRGERKLDYVAPPRKGLSAQCSIMASWEEMATETKEIVDGAMNRQKPLGLARRFELSHLVFTVACGLMRDFGSVVSSAVLAVADAW